MFARPDVPKRPAWLTPIQGGLRRLDGNDIAELEFFWQVYESRISYRSHGFEFTSRSIGGSYSHPLAEQPALIAIERATKIHRTLQRVPDLHRVVLFQVYGGTKRPVALGSMGDVASIVAYTPEVERLAAKLDVSPIEAIIQGLKGPESAVFVASMRNAGERLLCAAAESYRQAKRGEPCTSPRS